MRLVFQDENPHKVNIGGIIYDVNVISNPERQITHYMSELFWQYRL